MLFAKCSLNVAKSQFFIDFCRVPIMIFGNFAVFDHIWHDSTEHFAFRPVDFSAFGMDPDDFLLKIHEISAFRAKRFLGVARSDPELKINVFFKVFLERDQIANFNRFL